MTPRLRWWSSKFTREGWRIDSGPQYGLDAPSRYDDDYIMDGEVARVTWRPLSHAWEVLNFLNQGPNVFEVRKRWMARQTMQRFFDEHVKSRRNS